MRARAGGGLVTMEKDQGDPISSKLRWARKRSYGIPENTLLLTSLICFLKNTLEVLKENIVW